MMSASPETKLRLLDSSENSTERGPDALGTSEQPPKSLGENFRRARETKKISLEQAAQDLRISGRYLKAIEQGATSDLPERVYALGFVRTYAHYLGFNGAEALAQFKKETLGESKGAPLAVPIPIQEKSTPGTFLILGSLALGGLALLGWSWMHFFQKPTLPPVAVQEVSEEMRPAALENVVEEDAPAISPALSPPQESVGETDPSNSSSEPFLPASEGRGAVTLSVTDLAWLELRDPQGQVVFSQTYAPGFTHLLEKPEGYTLDMGNAGGVKITMDGTEHSLGKKGEVVRGFSLSRENLNKRFSASSEEIPKEPAL